MPTATSPDNVERALEETGNGWVLNMGGRADLLRRVAVEIDEFIREYQRRFGDPPDPFALLDENPDKAAAFFELYTKSPVSMDMKIAVWELINGAVIRFVSFRYQIGSDPQFTIGLITEHRPDILEFRGDSLRDFKITGHFGVLSVGGQEMFDGYYAFRR